MAERAGTNVGSALDGVGVGLADVDGDGVAAGESLAPGDLVGWGLDAGVTASVEVQLARTTARVAAHIRANRRGIVLQRRSLMTRAAPGVL